MGRAFSARRDCAARRPRGGDPSIRPTWAGLWMLGKETSIRGLLPHWHVSLKELPDDPADTRAEAALFQDGARASSPHSDPSSPHNSSPHREPHDVIERVRASRRAPPPRVRAAMLCSGADAFVPVSELATALNRDPVTIQQNDVAKMVAERLLVLLHPSTPNHPAQAYRRATDRDPQ